MKLTAFGSAKNAGPLTQCVKIVKLTALFLVLGLLQVAARGTAQVTLKEQAASLEKVLVSIKQQSGYSLFFDRALLTSKGRPVMVNVTNVPVERALKEIFKNQDQLTYTIDEKLISIKEKFEKKSDGALTPDLSPGLTPALPPATIDVTITVLNTDNQPLEGASIIIKGSNKGIATDVNGRATLRGVDANATIIISFTGYASQEYKLASNPGLKSGVNSPTPVVIRLVAGANELNEVIVNKGYYTEKQKLSTSNVGQVTAKEITRQPVANPLLALQGKIPSLIVSQTTGIAGSGVAVQIQGRNSLATGIGNDPLYVIDGVPYPSQMLFSLSRIQGHSGGTSNQAGVAAGAGNPLSFINPGDIESIDILKDADATAIYGSRAANGAILITTKKGKAGKTKVDINMQTGWGKVGSKLDLLNTQQYLEMRKEAYMNDGLPLPNSSNISKSNVDLTLWDQNRYTNWQKELIGGTSQYNDVQATVSGGNANTQFLIGAGYHRETTVFPGNLSDQKGSLHFNVNNVSPNRKFRLQLTGSYLVDNNQLINVDLTRTAMQLAPNAPAIYNSDGSLNWAPLPNGTSSWSNPLAELNNQYTNKTTNLISNVVLGYQILPGLDFKSNLGYTNLQSNQILIFPWSAVLPEFRQFIPRASSFTSNNINSWIAEPQLNYRFLIGKAKFELLTGTTIHQNNSSVNGQRGEGYSSDLVLKNVSSAPTHSVSNNISIYRYNALFGRLNINWDDKYIINLTARRDGSSRFGSENQFNNFGSIGSAWLFYNEKFAKKLPLSFGKLRISYGTTGNDQIGDYRTLNLYNSVGVATAYQGATGLSPTGLTNPHLQWEETRKLQFGLDLGFIHDKVTITANYYHNRSSNQLITYVLPIQTGFSGITRNFPAVVQNTGCEFVLNTVNISATNFSWSSSFNLTLPRNRLIDFPNLPTSSYNNTYIVGQPLNIAKVYRSLGVDPGTGLYIFSGINGTPTATPNPSTDRTVILDFSQGFYGGLQNNIRYKGLELDVLFQFVKQQASNYFAGETPGNFYGTLNNGNQPVYILDRWRKLNDNALIQRPGTQSDVYTSWNNLNSSDGVFSDASYVRLKNISMSCQLPEKWKRKVSIQNCRLYVQGQNLFTITDYKGLDPETKSSFVLPPLRVITIGVQVGL